MRLFKKCAEICTRRDPDLVSEIRGRGIDINCFWAEENKLEGVTSIERNRVERAYRICLEVIRRIRKGEFVEPNFSDVEWFHAILNKVVLIRKGQLPHDGLQEGEIFWLEDFMVYSNPANVVSKENDRKIRNAVRSVAYEAFLKETTNRFANVDEALKYFNVAYNREDQTHGI